MSTILKALEELEQRRSAAGAPPDQEPPYRQRFARRSFTPLLSAVTVGSLLGMAYFAFRGAPTPAPSRSVRAEPRPARQVAVVDPPRMAAPVEVAAAPAAATRPANVAPPADTEQRTNVAPVNLPPVNVAPANVAPANAAPANAAPASAAPASAAPANVAPANAGAANVAPAGNLPATVALADAAPQARFERAVPEEAPWGRIENGSGTASNVAPAVERAAIESPVARPPVATRALRESPRREASVPSRRDDAREQPSRASVEREPPTREPSGAVEVVSIAYSADVGARSAALRIGGQTVTLRQGDSVRGIEVQLILPGSVYLRRGRDIFAVDPKR